MLEYLFQRCGVRRPGMRRGAARRLALVAAVAVAVAVAVTAGAPALRAADEVETVAPISETFEKYTPGSVPPEVQDIAKLKAKGATIEVSEDTAAGGTKALKVVGASGLAQPWWPHLCYSLRGRKVIARGDVTLAFDVNNSSDAPADFTIETRDWTGNPFVSGPTVTFHPNGDVDLPGKPKVATLPLGQWSHVEATFAMTEATGRVCKIRITLPDKSTQEQELGLDDKFRTITWLGLITSSQAKAVYYIDNLNLAVTRPKETKTMQTPFTNFTMRGNLMRSFATFTKGGEVRVAFMGGSVTTQVWREEVMDYLKDRFPNAAFDFVMAGIGGTDANLGAFRLPSQVFGRGKVDLFFLEFAVNGGGGQPMEGIVRQAKRLNPDIDIVMMYFANTGYMEDVKAGRVPGLVQQHEKVAEHYGIPVLSLYKEVGERIQAGKLTWQDFSRDSVHPTDKGCAVYSECIVDFLRQAWTDPNLKAAGPVATLPEKLDPTCFENGRFIEVDAAKVKSGFTVVKGWRTEKTCNFAPPVDVLEATQPGNELALEFEGTAVGMYTIIGFDAGTLEYSIDNGPVQTKDQFDVYCDKFHRPQYAIFATNLPPGKHTLVLRMSAAKNAKSTGTAARILKFMAN